MEPARTFRRPPPLFAPWLMYFMAAWVGAIGIGHLVTGRPWWGAANLAAAAFGLAGDRWMRRTPIARMSGNELIFYGSFFVPTSRIPLDAIATVDRSEPSIVKLVLKDGATHRIPLQWILWEDQPEFISAIQSGVEGATGGPSSQVRRAGDPREHRR